VEQGDGCAGGGNGYTRAFCVESDVALHGCQWYGKPKGCGQQCPGGTILLARNSWIGGASTGCQTGYYSSLCCSAIEAQTQVAMCSQFGLDIIYAGGLGRLVEDAANSRQVFYQRLGGTQQECALQLAQEADRGKVPSSPYIMDTVPGSWVMDTSNKGVFFNPAYNRGYPPPEPEEGCTATDTIYTTVTQVTSTKTASCTAFPQACAHYHSVVSNARGLFDILTCPYIATKRRPAVAKYTQEHKNVWVAHTSSGPCQRDEYPPRAFVNAEDWSPYARQSIRLLPRDQNRDAGQLWGPVCAYPAQRVVTEAGPVNNQRCTEYVSTVRSVNAFTFGWGDLHTLTTADDLLSENPCTITITDDVGFALLTEDAWYGVNILSGHNSAAYALNAIPAALLPRGLQSLGEIDGSGIPSGIIDWEDESVIIDDGNSSQRLSFKGYLEDPDFKRTMAGTFALDSEGNYYTPAQTTSDSNTIPTGSPSSLGSDRNANDYPPRSVEDPRPGSGIPPAVIASATYERSLPEITQRI
jgi:hypothetical protein